MATARKRFPQVYRLEDSKTGNPYWLVSARSRKWGLNERKAFPEERAALDYAKAIEARLQATGAQPLVPVEMKRDATAYAGLRERLAPYSRTPEEAVEHFLKWLGAEALRNSKPSIEALTGQWEEYKRADTTLDPRTLKEVEMYARFIRSKWGTLKPDDIKKNDIDLTLKGIEASNNTRRKYLTYIRQFLKWVKDAGYILNNPSDGIRFKPEPFEAKFYTPEETAKLLRYVATEEPGLVGYYSLLTFAGLRPTEGARVEWQDIGWNTCELYVRAGKTEARHIPLEPVAMAWLKWHRGHVKEGEPFITTKALPNREKRVREFMGEWHQDGLRHGFATYFKNLKRDINLTAEVMGNSPSMVKKHYARTIEAAKVAEFWGLIPQVVV